MGRIARRVLARLSGILWLAAGVLVLLRITRDLDHMASVIVYLTALAATGTVCAQVQERRDEHLIARAKELAVATRPPQPQQPTRVPLRRAQ